MPSGHEKIKVCKSSASIASKASSRCMQTIVLPQPVLCLSSTPSESSKDEFCLCDITHSDNGSTDLLIQIIEKNVSTCDANTCGVPKPDAGKSNKKKICSHCSPPPPCYEPPPPCCEPPKPPKPCCIAKPEPPKDKCPRCSAPKGQEKCPNCSPTNPCCEDNSNVPSKTLTLCPECSKSMTNSKSGKSNHDLGMSKSRNSIKSAKSNETLRKRPSNVKINEQTSKGCPMNQQPLEYCAVTPTICKQNCPHSAEVSKKNSTISCSKYPLPATMSKAPYKTGGSIASDSSRIMPCYTKNEKGKKKKGRGSKTSIKSGRGRSESCTSNAPQPVGKPGCTCHFPPAFSQFFHCSGAITGNCCCNCCND